MAFICSACRVPIGRRYGYCTPCDLAYLKSRRRVCTDCRTDLPKGRVVRRCTACQRAYIRRRANRWGRVCACGAKIKRGKTMSVCRACSADAKREYRARKHNAGTT